MFFFSIVVLLIIFWKSNPVVTHCLINFIGAAQSWNVGISACRAYRGRFASFVNRRIPDICHSIITSDQIQSWAFTGEFASFFALSSITWVKCPLNSLQLQNKIILYGQIHLKMVEFLPICSFQISVAVNFSYQAEYRRAIHFSLFRSEPNFVQPNGTFACFGIVRASFCILLCCT